MKKVKLKDISTSVSSGLTPLRSNKLFWDGGKIPWLKTEQLGVKYIDDTNEKITQHALDTTSIKINPINSLSIAMYGEGKTRGNVSILKQAMTTNQACCNVIINPAYADYEYVYYFLKSRYEKIRSLASGVRKNLNSNDIKNLEIILPNTIADQNNIASVLSAIDSKIELNNKINSELELIAKLIYDYWFVQFDFPDEYGKPYKSNGGEMVWNEELKRKIPENWTVGGFEDLGYIIGGSTPSKSNKQYFTENGIPWITPKDLSLNSSNKFISRGETDVTQLGVKNASLKFLPKGSILLTSRAPIGYIAISRDKVTTNQGFKSLVPKDPFSTEYVFYTVQLYIKAMKQYASGSTFSEISASTLKMIRIPIPNFELIKIYTRKIDSIFAQQNILELENEKLSELRNWLLPILINGQVKIKDN